MQNKKFFKAAAFFALTLLSSIGTAHAAPRCADYPLEVADYLRAHPGWSIVQFSDLLSDDQALWNKYHRGQCPGLVQADFDGSGRKFYALALLKHSNEKLIEKAVVFRRVKQRIEEHTLSGTGPVPYVCVIWRTGPGKTHAWDSTKEFFIAHDSVIFEQMEAWAYQYYYSRGRFRVVVTSN